jgi:type II secretory pathway pseudopilin PulG
MDKLGWTLMEVLVTAAIVGIMGTLGVSTFQSGRARSLQAEVRANLSSLSALERTYLIHARSYTACILDTGFEPVALSMSKRAYAYGLTQTEALSTKCGAYGNQNCRQAFSKAHPNGTSCRNNAFFLPAQQTFGSVLVDTTTEFESVFQAPLIRPFVEQTRFRICGAGSIRSGTRTDVWCATDDGGLRQEASGL